VEQIWIERGEEGLVGQIIRVLEIGEDLECLRGFDTVLRVDFELDLQTSVSFKILTFSICHLFQNTRLRL
jgi:hypothetical protein